MVTVSSFNVRERKDGTSFITLELTGGLEIVTSQNTGRNYATVRKCSMPSTFSEEIAKTLIGTQLPGEIVREICDPYEYTNKQTGEVMTLAYSYAYRPSAQAASVGHTRIQEVQAAF